MVDLDFLIAIVKETDEIFFDEKLRGDVFVKGDSDFVTRADLAISEYMKKRLTEEFPDIGFISEEEEMHAEEGKSYWILDPIDGTTNFMHAMPVCGLSLGLYEGGDITLGVIYAPYTQELFWAQKGKGAYLNGKRISCSQHEKLSDCIGALEYNAYYKNDYKAAFEQAKNIFFACQDIRTIGSATMELAYVACGRLDAFLGRYLKPWDYAAAKILIEEAGGKLSDLGGEIRLLELKRHIVATNANVHEEFLQLLK